MDMYKEIIDLLPTKEKDSAVAKMVNNYDLTGAFFKTEHNRYGSKSEKTTFTHYFTLSDELNDIINETAIIEGRKLFMTDPLMPIDDHIDCRKEEIYRSILEHFAALAKRVSDNRDYLRIKEGALVNYDECTYSFPFNGKIEFYKDGGWGIGNRDGLVLVKNHLMKQPSKTFPFNNDPLFPYILIQDRDTKKYGILSYITWTETILCEYDEIKMTYYNKEDKCHYFLLVNKNGKIGCFNDNCDLIIDYVYDNISVVDEYLECLRDGSPILFDIINKPGYDVIVSGKKDLYNNNGELVIGGYDNLDFSFGYFLFYFGTYYEDYYEETSGIRDDYIRLNKIRLNYEDSLCLILDKEFKTIVQNKKGYFRMPKGFVIDSLESLKSFVPIEFLFNYKVDLSHLQKGYIYLYNYYGVQYMIPDYILRGFYHPEECYSCIDSIPPANYTNNLISSVPDSTNNGGSSNNEFIEFFEDKRPCFIIENLDDMFHEDSLVTIIKINNNNIIEWHYHVNDIGRTDYNFCFYRIGDNIGLYDEREIGACIFNAITTRTNNGRIYVARYIYEDEEKNRYKKDIQFYSIEKNGKITRIEDNWKIFNPTNYNWYPYDFIENNYDIGVDLDYNNDDEGYEWTDEDAWDAMTDGAYGDYPGPLWDPEVFGF